MACLNLSLFASMFHQKKQRKKLLPNSTSVRQVAIT